MMWFHWPLCSFMGIHSKFRLRVNLVKNQKPQCLWGRVVISAWTLFRQVYNLSNFQHFRFCFCFFLFSGPVLSCFCDVLFERPLLASQQLFGNFQHVSHDLIILFGREGSSREAKFIQMREIQIRTWNWRSGHTPVFLFGSFKISALWI